MKKDTTNLFMWKWQKFQSLAFKLEAENIFKKLDKDLIPNLFLLGVLVEDLKERHSICLEPEDCGFDVKNLKNIIDLAKQLEKVDEDNKIFNSHPFVQKQQDEYIHKKSYMDAILKILKREERSSLKFERYISYPTLIDGYFVFIVLELPKSILEKYYSLRNHDNNSLIEILVKHFLYSCSEILKDSENYSMYLNKTSDEIITASGNNFMNIISNSINNSYNLYETCNIIASLKYEGDIGLGKMIICKKDHDNIKMTLQLKEPIRIKDYRKVRKFLEISNNHSCIITDGNLIYGLGKLIGKYNPTTETMFEILFTGYYKWELFHDSNALMVVEFKSPSLPAEKIDKTKFYTDFRRFFKKITTEEINNLWEITLEATNQKHGTMLVISDNAEIEAKRLGKQCFPLNPLKLTKDVIPLITSIDGAVLLDRNSNCHAIGVILDGIATDKGDSSRGARYNSAIKYFDSSGQETSLILVIISEDGMVDLIPNLKPQINRFVIDEKIDELKKLSIQEKIDEKVFNKIMDFLQNLEFYLSDENCKIINKLNEKIGKQLDDSIEVGELGRFKYANFYPNNEMNNNYYLKI